MEGLACGGRSGGCTTLVVTQGKKEREGTDTDGFIESVVEKPFLSEGAGVGIWHLQKRDEIGSITGRGRGAQLMRAERRAQRRTGRRAQLVHWTP